ncbi:MAG: DUF2845 domain-containing protein [Candidatus Krumholzibacteria bacterium]|nr:DUF2845 domain-containing protein [Candidatus Krumholzibacteria bacterium]
MNSVHHILLVALFIATTTSCAHTPRLPQDNPEVTSVRDHYLRTHPDGVYNQHIMKGEVARGMNVIEVLASWGLPERRLFDDATQSVSTESWIYSMRDEFSRDRFTYQLVFEDRVLLRWTLDKGTAAGGGLWPSNAMMDRRRVDDGFGAPTSDGRDANTVSPRK